MAKRSAKKACSSQERPRRPREGITGLSVKGFKCLARKCSIDVRPLTLLAGANSSGKSSMIQPLLMLKQTLEAPYDPGALLIDGPNVRFTETAQLLSRLPGKKGRDPSFTIEIQRRDDVLSETFRKHPTRGLELVEQQYPGPSGMFALRPGLGNEEIRARIPKAFRERDEAMAKEYEGRSERPPQWVVIRSRSFLGLSFRSPDENDNFYLTSPAVWIGGDLRDVIHVPGLRGNPARTYKTTPVGPEFPGAFQDYVASVIHYWQEEKDPRLNELGGAMEALGLTWKIGARQVDDTQVELRVGRMPHPARGGARDLVSVADVGFGISQVLPVVVALLVAKPEQIVCLEQPEIHLHPRAQVGLAELLVDAARRKVRVIAETHSPLLLLAVQKQIASGRLAPDQVSLNWFHRDERTGVTKVTAAEMDEAGAFGNWPVDFADVTLDAQGAYLDAAQARLSGVKE